MDSIILQKIAPILIVNNILTYFSLNLHFQVVSVTVFLYLFIITIYNCLLYCSSLFIIIVHHCLLLLFFIIVYYHFLLLFIIIVFLVTLLRSSQLTHSRDRCTPVML